MKIVIFIYQILQEKFAYGELFMLVTIGYIFMFKMVKKMQNSGLEILAGLTRPLTYFIFGHGESSPYNIWSMMNLERTCVLLFGYFLCLKVNLDLEKTNQFGESSPILFFLWWILTR